MDFYGMFTGIRGCPFCKARSESCKVLELEDDSGECFVYCKECEARGPLAVNERLAIVEWAKALVESDFHNALSNAYRFEAMVEVLRGVYEKAGLPTGKGGG